MRACAKLFRWNGLLLWETNCVVACFGQRGTKVERFSFARDSDPGTGPQRSPWQTWPTLAAFFVRKERPQAAYRSPGSFCSSVVVDFSFGTDATDMAVGIGPFPAHLMIRRIGYRTPALSAVQLAILPHIYSRQIIRAKQPMDHCLSVLQQGLWLSLIHI